MGKNNECSPFATIAPEEMDDPFGVISELCSWTTLFDLREQIEDVFEQAMASDGWAEDKPLEKAGRMFRLKQLKRMVEVVYLLDELREKGELLKVIEATAKADGVV